MFSSSPQNVTVMFSSGVGVEVRRHEGTMAVTVLLPTQFTNHTQGLLGQMNSDPSDDLLTSQGVVITSDSATPEEIFTFGAGCESKSQDVGNVTGLLWGNGKVTRFPKKTVNRGFAVEIQVL